MIGARDITTASVDECVRATRTYARLIRRRDCVDWLTPFRRCNRYAILVFTLAATFAHWFTAAHCEWRDLFFMLAFAAGMFVTERTLRSILRADVLQPPAFLFRLPRHYRPRVVVHSQFRTVSDALSSSLTA